VKGKQPPPGRLVATDEARAKLAHGHVLVEGADGRFDLVAPRDVRDVAEKAKRARELGFDFNLGPDLAKPVPPPVWLCKDFGLWLGRPNIISGFASSAKTWLAIELGLCAAANRKTIWGGVPIQLWGKVRHFDWENPGNNTRRRYQRVAFALGIDLAGLGDQIGHVPLPRIYLTSEGAEAAFVRACDGVVVAIVDSFRAASPGVDENSSAVRELLDLLLRVSDKTQTVFVVLHHESKESNQTSGRSAAQRMRGSGAIVDAIDASVRVHEVGENTNVFNIEPGKRSNKTAGAVVVRLEDVGEIDLETGLSPGVRIVPVDGADGDRSQSPKNRMRECADAMLEVLRKAKRPMGNRELRAGVNYGAQLTNESLKLLRETGEVTQDAHQRYTIAEKSRGFRGSGVAAAPRGSGDAPSRPLPPERNRGSAGSARFREPADGAGFRGSSPFRGNPAPEPRNPRTKRRRSEPPLKLVNGGSP